MSKPPVWHEEEEQVGKSGGIQGHPRRVDCSRSEKNAVIQRNYSFSRLLMSRTSFLIEFTNFVFEILTSSK